MSDERKICESHRRRRAVVYVRQSSPAQVAANVESAARQYALRERALGLGWPATAISVVDEDTGRSGASSAGRLGFKELVAEVGLGQVGLVLALEVSRLARCSADWHQLLDLCALTGTLIADQDGVYSPAEFNDRLLLGLKGTMSEGELHLIRTRLDGGLRNKAERGELRLHLPVGLDRDERGQIVLSADEQVRAAIGRVFSLWRRLGSARQVFAELVAEGERLPRRRLGERRIRWASPTYAAVRDFLTNPAYAGAFAFGRTREEKRLGPDGQLRVGVVELPFEEWAVCLPDHHPGYVSWEEYLATRERLRANTRPRGEGGGAAREGPALLQGLLRCGRCGRRMQVSYSGKDGRTPRYLCTRARDFHGAEAACQALGGRRLDRAVVEAFLEAVSPAAVGACASAIVELEAQHEERLAGQRLALERVEYEAERARRQYDACEPENRLVARTLERAYELALAEVEREQRALVSLEHARPEPLSGQERQMLARLARDLPRLWQATTTSDRERKELLRTLLCDVSVSLHRPEGCAEVELSWEGARARSCGCRSAAVSRGRARARTRSRSCAGWPSTIATARSPRSSTGRAVPPAPASPSASRACAACASAPGSPPRRHQTQRAGCSRSSRPPLSSASPEAPSAAGCRPACSPPSRSPRTRPGGSGSQTRSGGASSRTSPKASSR